MHRTHGTIPNESVAGKVSIVNNAKTAIDLLTGPQPQIAEKDEHDAKVKELSEGNLHLYWARSTAAWDKANKV